MQCSSPALLLTNSSHESSDHSAEDGTRFLAARRVSKNVPEPKSLVCSRAYNGAAVGALSQVKNASGVTLELRDLVHVRVRPKAKLVLRETVTAANLLVVLAPKKGTHL